MNLLSAENISKAYSERWLFKNLSFGIEQGEKVALVGANGTGKSTLLKVLAGFIEPDSGKIGVRDGVRLGYLPQQPEFPAGTTVGEAIYQEGNLMLTTIKRYEEAIIDPDFSADELQEILILMDELKAWDYETVIHQVCAKLGLTDLEIRTEALSGGQKKRLALAQLLLSDPDLIIMDEPTNHLDLQAIEWLENFLSGQNRSVIMVTHDRYFLNNVTNSIVELDKGQMYRYKGDYAYFLEKKAEREEMSRATVAKAKNLMAKELEWMRRMPKARGTKSKSRIEAFYELKDVATQNLSKPELEINLKASRQGNKVMELENVNKSYGDRPFVKDFTYVFKKKDRIGIVGKNGVGKSTFLDLITQRTQPDSGEVIWGPTTKIGYYTQDTEGLLSESRIIDEVKAIAEYITLGDGSTVSVSKFLEMFLFPPAMQYTPIGKLSGGERRRLQLLKVLVTSPNLLILDEPTNDLDIDTLNVLEEYLEQFEGSLMLVSHDRYFMDRLVEHLFVFEGDGIIRDFHGNYSDYRDDLDEREKAEATKPKGNAAPVAKVVEPVVAPKPVVTEAPKKKRSFKEQKEYDDLEAAIASIESKKLVIVDKMNSGAISHEDIAKLAKELQAMDDDLEMKTLRWLELADMV